MFNDNELMTTKKVLLQGKIPEEMKQMIDKTVEEHRFNITLLVEAMAELWVSLPDSVQVDLYSRRQKGVSIEDIINEIVALQIKELWSAQSLDVDDNAAQAACETHARKGQRHKKSKSG